MNKTKKIRIVNIFLSIKRSVIVETCSGENVCRIFVPFFSGIVTLKFYYYYYCCCGCINTRRTIQKKNDKTKIKN